MRSLVPLSVVLLSLVACGGEDTDVPDDRPSSPEPFDIALGDTEDCAAYEKTTPEDDQIGGWVVGRIETPWTPAQIEQVLVRLDGRRPCTLTEAGEIRVAAGGDEPPENPDFLFFQSLEAGDEGPATVITLTLPATYIDEGQNLYVYTRLSGSEGSTRCVSVCQDEDKPDENWITSQGDAPFTYAPLDIYGSLAIEVVGQSPVTIPE